jgi:epoxyqueuosine reductase
MGSYLQLLGYLTDARLPVDPAWQPCEPRLLDECAGCRICEALCPTSAIVPDRVLLHAERCLTLASETAGAWPAWVPLSDLDCLVGCLRCQESCPANPDLPIAPSGVTFTGEETSALLAGRGDDPGCVGPGIHAKFNQLGLSAPERLVVGRNLRALVRPERTAS